MYLKPGDIISVSDRPGDEPVHCVVLRAFPMLVDHPEDPDRAYYAHYVLYTDGSQDELGQTRVFGSTYDPTEEEQDFSPIQSEEEWEKLQQLVEDACQAAVEDRRRREAEPSAPPSSPAVPFDPELPFP